MNIEIFNTFSKKNEIFQPIDSNNVRIYVCGPTVYDIIHIGNARPLIVFDVLVRFLKLIYPKVTYVRNITDVDDKIIIQSQKNNESITELTSRTIEAFAEDAKSLYVLKPDYEPKATEHIPEMLKIIKTLIGNNNAYVSNGHVFFSVSSMSKYGELSGMKLDEMIDGARVDVDSNKKEPGDFVLWKPSNKEELGWHSEYGYGRPGWHIECSAMSEKFLGKQFDIHGGGLDLIFPHHENEIAQSCCAFQTDFMAKYWMHNGYITVNNEKMSKSEGNFITVRDALKKFSGEVIRYSILSGHYRSPINFSFETLSESKTALDRLYRCSENYEFDEHIDEEFLVSLSNDLNTPKAISRLHELAKDHNRGNKASGQLLKSSSRILGLLNIGSSEWFTKTNLIDENKINKMVLDRNKARSEKNFELADEIRDSLKEMGIYIEDSEQGTKWRIE